MYSLLGHTQIHAVIKNVRNIPNNCIKHQVPFKIVIRQP